MILVCDGKVCLVYVYWLFRYKDVRYNLIFVLIGNVCCVLQIGVIQIGNTVNKVFFFCDLRHCFLFDIHAFLYVYSRYDTSKLSNNMCTNNTIYSVNAVCILQQNCFTKK